MAFECRPVSERVVHEGTSGVAPGGAQSMAALAWYIEIHGPSDT